MLVYCRISGIWQNPGMILVPFLRGKRMSWSNLCTGPLDPALMFKALPSQSAGSSSKFVVPKLPPSVGEVVCDTEMTVSKECHDQSSQAPVDVAHTAESCPNAGISISEKTWGVGKKRSLPIDYASALPGPKKMLKKKKRSVAEENNSPDSSRSSSPSDSSDEIVDDRLPDPKAKEFIPLPVDHASSDKIPLIDLESSLSSLREKFTSLRLHESVKPPQIVKDGSSTYTPDWPISRGSTLKTEAERREILFWALPPGARDVFSQSPNNALVKNFTRYMIGSFPQVKS